MRYPVNVLLTGVIASVCAFSSSADDHWDISKIDVSKLPPPAAAKGLTYAKDIRPLLETACFRCHGEEKQKGDLRVDSRDALLKGGEVGKVIVPGNSKKSLLVAAVAQLNDDIAMPPKMKPRGGGPGGPGGPGAGGPPPGGGPGRGPGGPGGFGPPPKPFTAEQVGLVRAWIDQGAK
jgi:hypothetical protein